MRPARPCPFCKTMQTHLSRHILAKHKSEEEVNKILSLPEEQKVKKLSLLRKKGIFEHNKVVVGDDGNNNLLRERKGKSDSGGECDGAEEKSLKICGKYKGVFGRWYIWRHRKVCTGNSVMHDVSLPSFCASSKCESDIPLEGNFYKEVIAKLRDDKCGLLIRSDKLVMHVGLHYYRTSPKKDRKLVMTHMRRLGCLLSQFQSVAGNENLKAEDMINRKNFAILTQALEDCCSADDGDVKHNLKLALGYLLKKTAHVLQGLCLIDGSDARYEEAGKFKQVLEFHWGELFGEAVYKADKRRQEKLRKPRELPLEDDLQVLRAHCQKVMSELTADEYHILDHREFGRLRAALVTRLTIFNARRGSEPARMTLTDWETGERGEWIDPQTMHHVADEERELLNRMKLVYMEGKGTKDMVPVIVPEECLSAIRRLIAERHNCGIHAENKYVFPYGQQSTEHVIGWHEIRKMSLEANVAQPNLVTANRVRHRAATIHAASDYSEKEKKHSICTWVTQEI